MYVQQVLLRAEVLVGARNMWGFAEWSGRFSLIVNQHWIFAALALPSPRRSPDCGIATLGCDFSIAGCADGGGSSTLVGGDDATSATSSDRALPTTDDGTSVTDATSSGTTACQAEQDACLVEDSACLSCAEAIAAGTSAVEAACQDADYDDATASCSEKSEVACCSVQEGPECLADPDDLLVVWLGGCRAFYEENQSEDQRRTISPQQ